MRQAQEEDNTIRGIFDRVHGDFMANREAFDPDVELRVRYAPYQRIGGEPGDFDLYGYDFDAEIPAMISTESYLLFGAYQYGRHYATSSGFGSKNNATGIGDRTVTAAGVRLGLGVFLADNWLLEVETNPGVYSDLEAPLTHKDYDFYSSMLFTVETIDHFYLKFGARYNQTYINAPWLPYLGFSWVLAPEFRIDLLLPEKLELTYSPSASTSFSLGTMIQGAQYFVHAPNGQGNDIQVQEIISYLGMLHRFDERFSLAMRAGAIVAGDYRLNNGTAGFDDAEGTLDPGFYADVTFGINW
ncbi:MAG: hypothetical protein H6835_13750 [Planctomycetes bacterium]|nr:hypothetical protein [Planctomycetota bacterium]